MRGERALKTVLIGLDGATFAILNPLMEKGIMPFLKTFCARGTQGKLLSTLPHVTPTAWTSLVTGRSPGNHGIFDFVRAEENKNGLYVRFLDARDVRSETIWSMVCRQGKRVTSLNFPLTGRFEDQAVRTAVAVARFLPEEAARLRQAMRQGTEEAMGEIEALFFLKCQQNGVDEITARTLFTQLQGFMGHDFGYMVPGFISWKHLRRHVYPPELHGELLALPGFDLKEVAWDMEKEQKSVQMMPLAEYAAWIESHIRREQQWFEIVRHLMQTDPCDLTAIMFDGVDKLQHLSWHLLDPRIYPERPSRWEEETRALCLVYFRQLDTFLAEIVEMAGPDAHIFMASDHGFGPTWDIFYLNVWLQQQGYLQWSESGAQQIEPEAMFAGQTKGQRFDWDNTFAYALTPSSNGITIRVANAPEQSGIPPDEYDSFRRKLSDSLLSFTHPISGEPVVTRVVTREEAFSGSQMHLAPDLTLVLRDYGFISAANARSPLMSRTEAKGMHHPEGIFIAAGPGIRRGITVEPLSILDVCPALLYSLGLDIPSDLEGCLLTEMFEPLFLESHPPRIGEPTIRMDIVEPEIEKSPLLQEEEAMMIARLKALGYID